MRAPFLSQTCLRSSLSLRHQLLVSFGSIAIVTITLVVILATISALTAGHTIRNEGRDLMREQLFNGIKESSRLLAETISEKLDNLHGVSTITGELVKDRIAGYPDQGYEFDLHVPFWDIDTQTNVYPLVSPRVPLDWNITLNINEANADEHMQAGRTGGRAPLLSLGKTSTESASLFFQGVCDPSETEPSSSSYFPNCTQLNNDVNIGGVIQPTQSNYWLAQKAADIGMLLKPLYESQVDVGFMGVYMHNMGAGMALQFPGYIRDADSATSYTSIGCDWMREINSNTGEPIGTEEEISRCHPQGERVSNRNYNPMERSFCRDQVLNPGSERIFGPHKATTYGEWALSFGEAVFDRVTGHFVACVAVDVAIEGLQNDLKNLLIHNYEDVALARWDGTFVAGSAYNQSKNLETVVHVAQTGFIEEKTFRELLEKIDYRNFIDNPNNWSEYLQRLRNVVINVDPSVVSAYPLPVPPLEFDPNYKPEFIIILRASEAVFEAIDIMDEAINHDVFTLILSSFCIGFSGIIVVLSIVWSVSRLLTQPLNWMESVAWRIVNHTDKRVGQALHVVDENDKDDAPSIRCAPRTEITELVEEFRKMIRGFSGHGASSVAKSTFEEIANVMKWQNCFQQLYRSYPNNDNDITGRFKMKSSTKKGPGESSDFEASELLDLDQPSTSFVSKINAGRLVHSRVYASSDQVKQHLEQELDGQKIRVCHVSLFLWIMVLIVIPLVITNIAICALVMRNILQVLPSWVQLAEEGSTDLAMGALDTAALLRASFAEQILIEPMRDLFLLTRLGGLLFFEGINRSTGFTQLDSAVEECKIYSDDRSCPYYDDLSRTPCDCAWNDAYDRDCQIYQSDTRNLLRRSFMAQAQDADQLTGNRFNISYPKNDVSPETTSWWRNISDIPGSWKGSNASGHETAYDRLRVSSALAIYEFPIYNYLNRRKNRKHILGTYIGFEADGSFGGFGGCEYAMAQMAQFQSNEGNKAAEVGGNLCPLGKYGYDPRCRDWYGAGKNSTLLFDEAVHITAPYTFAVEKIIALSATSSLVDPVSGEHVAQTLVDFLPQGMFDALNDTGAYFFFVISRQEDSNGVDTIVGPNHTVESDPIAADDLILKYDPENSTNRDDFIREVMDKMKEGETSSGNFTRIMEDGSLEALVMSYAPVHVSSLLPLRPDDFSRGCSYKDKFVYSLGLSLREEDLHQPFHDIEEDVDKSLDRLAMIYLILVVVISIFGTVFTCAISVAISKPMIILLRVIRSINHGRVEDDIPPMRGGSREVNQVYSSFAKLYKIVRFSYVAFFSGNLKWAYHFVSDALKLFRKIKDQKAIAVASNNLGNTLSAMSMEKSFLGSGSKSCNQVDGICCVKAAIGHFNEAVDLGKGEFDAAKLDELKADYAQQLADRHFNRALLYLIPRKCGCTSACLPGNAKELGYQDLKRAKELDYDVRDFWLQHKLMLKNSHIYFERNIRRLCGLVCLDGDERCRDIWSFKELLDATDQLLFAAWDEPTAPLFHEMSRVGRLQQLEVAAILLELGRNNEVEAARLGIRMFVEDEFLIDYALRVAGNAILRFTKRDISSPWTDDSISSLRSDLRKMTRHNKHGGSLNLGNCFVLCLDVSKKLQDETVMSKISTNCLLLFDEYFSKDDYVGLVAFDSDPQNMELGRKGQREQQQRRAIEMSASRATDKISRQALPYAIKMVADSKASEENDTFILCITDGSSWDFGSFAKVTSQIEHLNNERKTDIHIIIVGLDLQQERIVEQCTTLRTVSRNSEYVEASRDSLDAAFDIVTGLITSVCAPEALLRGITMEKF